MNHEPRIRLDADDYGETINISRDIIGLLKEGCLDGISILANMSSYEESAAMLLEAVPDMPFVPVMNVHIDLVEGHSLIPAGVRGLGAEDDRHTGDDRRAEGDRRTGDDRCAKDDHRAEDDRHTGYVCGELLPWSWKSLFLLSYHIPVRDRSGRRMRYAETYERLCTEISAQILRVDRLVREVTDAADRCGIAHASQNIRIDSHQHAHLIPIVRKALEAVIEKDDLNIDDIRTAHEPLGPFVRHIGSGFKPIGFVKNRVLAVLAPVTERSLKARGIRPSYLWGLIMSGHMDAERIERIMPDMLRRCKQAGYDLELNIHPGRMLEAEWNEEIPRDSADTFYLTGDRTAEAETARKFKSILQRIKDGSGT